MKIQTGIAEGQVLQRLGRSGATVELSGSVKEPGPILATLFNSKGALKGWKGRRVGHATRGKFVVRIAGIPAGGPYRLDLCSQSGNEMDRVKTFFVGDVWILAGQSNMQGCGDRGGAARTHPLVRTFSLRREWRLASDPLHVLTESPDVCHHEGEQCSPREGERLRKIIARGVGVGVFFARKMWERSGVPQGLICAAQGGTRMQEWSPDRKNEGGASLYASMTASWKSTGQPVAGILWDQGQSDANMMDAPHYAKRMRRLIKAIRRDLGQPLLPWLVVQVARFFGPRPQEDIASWNFIQEQQRLLPEKIKRLETISAIDLAMDDSNHIGSDAFPLLADRIARAAARLVYGHRREKRPPRLGKIFPARLRDPFTATVDIRFDDVVGGLQAPGHADGFSLIETDGADLHKIYKTTLHGNIARIHFQTIDFRGLRLSYGHGSVPHCNIFDGRGFALPAFGPLALGKPTAWLPFIGRWKASGIISSPAPLEKISVPGPKYFPASARIASDDKLIHGFINEHSRWEGKSGHCYFAARLDLPERMRLEFLMGYDGPFRVWVDQNAFFQDLDAVNPCIPDRSRKSISLAAGLHDLRVAMDLNDGKAWGFLIRFERKDVTAAQCQSGNFVKPSYSL